MECSHWNEKGLLFTSEELDEVEIKEFSSHLQECNICKNELEQYEEEKAAYFIPEFFEETPSGHIDNEIIRICSKPKNYTASYINFQSLFKNTFFAILVLAIGFGGGTYFAGLNNASDSKTTLNKKPENKIDKNNDNSIVNNVTSNNTDGDFQIPDSINNDSLPKTYRRGNINMDGVHSVTDK
ncbi:MAG: hypothetical protein PVI26_01040 [Chitinispirillia bacterium]|jgi:hypothetical protein